MSLAHILLGMLYKKPQSGYDLNKQMNAVIHYFWEADQSRIYRTLRDLQDKGWVEFQMLVQEGSPNKKLFSITPSGFKELQNWLAEPGKLKTENGRNPFLAQLHFSPAIPAAVQQKVLEERLKTLQDEVKELERRAENLKMPVPLPEDALHKGVSREMFSLEYGIRLYYFEIEWTADTIRVLQSAAQE